MNKKYIVEMKRLCQLFNNYKKNKAPTPIKKLSNSIKKKIYKKQCEAQEMLIIKGRKGAR